MRFSRNPTNGNLEIYTDEGMYVGVMSTSNEPYELTAQDGGPGSGNYGHAGRPGKVGGSAKGSGGGAMRSGSKETGYTSFATHKLFKSIASHARNAKTKAEFIHGMNDEQKDAIINQHIACGSKEGLGDYAERLYDMLHDRKGSEIRQQNRPVDGKDLSSTWQYEERKESWKSQGTKEIDTEIEAIIHEQGYDGVPKIVSRAEFDRMTDAHPEMPILFRTYAAPNQEKLDEYDNDLEHGFFYVDCSTGGSGFGQGMYCAGVYADRNGKSEEEIKKRKEILIQGAMAEMKHYKALNIRRIMDDQPHVPPEGMTMLIGGTNDEPMWKYYDPKDLRDFSTPPKDGELIAYMDDPKHEEFGEQIYKYEQPGIICSTEFNSKWDAEETDRWSPILGDCEAVELDPKASTRMMTLDPSAKIIKYEDLRELRAKLRDQRQEERSKMIAQARQEFLEDLTDRMMKANGITGERREKYKDLFTLWAYGSTNEDAIMVGQLKKELGEEEGRGLLGIFDRKWNAFEPPRPTWKPIPSDDGVFACMLGFDAIDAVGHGESKSYTVVLNRTKLVVCEDNVDLKY